MTSKYVKQPARIQHDAAQSTRMCQAVGCPMVGTYSPTGGEGARYACYVHAIAQSEQWPVVTERLIENEALRLGIEQVLKFNDYEWSRTGWEMMGRFFDGDLKPSEEERNHRPWYEYRLRMWLEHLCGVRAKPPRPRQKLPTQDERRAMRFAHLRAGV